MPAFSKEELVIALQKSVKDLQQGIDIHSCLIASILQNEVDARYLESFPEACPARSREERMKAALLEAIDELEESRKAFKSKRLEALRKRLTQVLADSQ